MGKISRIIMGVLIITTSFSGVAQKQQLDRMHRVKDGMEMVTISPANYMAFATAKGKICLNVSVDSVDATRYRVALYVFYPKGVDPTGSDIIIGYSNGMADRCVPVYVSKNDPEQTYVEYYLESGRPNLIKNFDFTYLNFDRIAQVKHITTPKYFRNFLKNY